MPVYRCKMCGGTLNVKNDSTVCECEFCGAKQTVPSTADDKKEKLFDRAQRMLARKEFDKAGTVYESIINEYPNDAEGYWGSILCRYGIEYVDDPITGEKKPTCHRASYESIMDDSDFELVMENADSLSRSLYRQQAEQIEEIRKSITAISGKEDPYDIFICYKETDENGSRTEDSVMAQDIYDRLTEKGYRVFFSRISLEDKLGHDYEPYIFAALNSARVMLVFGTCAEYFEAVWVKNEWNRFLKLMTKDHDKYLIPCYKGMEAYDMPTQFARFQAQDMGRIGAEQDLLRGIKKLLDNTNDQQNEVQNHHEKEAVSQRAVAEERVSQKNESVVNRTPKSNKLPILIAAVLVISVIGIILGKGKKENRDRDENVAVAASEISTQAMQEEALEDEKNAEIENISELSSENNKVAEAYRTILKSKNATSYITFDIDGDGVKELFLHGYEIADGGMPSDGISAYSWNGEKAYKISWDEPDGGQWGHVIGKDGYLYVSGHTPGFSENSYNRLYAVEGGVSVYWDKTISEEDIQTDSYTVEDETGLKDLVEKAGAGAYSILLMSNTAETAENGSGAEADTYERIPQKTYMYVVGCNENISLRVSPDKASQRIIHIPLYSQVEYIGEAANGFKQINYAGYVGYSLSEYLDYYEPQVATGIRLEVYNCNDWISLRTGPATSYDTICLIPLGSYVDFVEDRGDFYLISYNGFTGYSLKEYLRQTETEINRAFTSVSIEGSLIDCGNYYTASATVWHGELQENLPDSEYWKTNIYISKNCSVSRYENGNYEVTDMSWWLANGSTLLAGVTVDSEGFIVSFMDGTGF